MVELTATEKRYNEERAKAEKSGFHRAYAPGKAPLLRMVQDLLTDSVNCDSRFPEKMHSLFTETDGYFTEHERKAILNATVNFKDQCKCRKNLTGK